MRLLKRPVVRGTIILSVAGMITRVLGFIYRIYISNTAGAEGMGLYQLIMPVYFLTFTICAAGPSAALSKMAAVDNARWGAAGARKTAIIGVVFTALLGLTAAASLFVFSDVISVNILKESRAAQCLRLLAAAIPFAVSTSCIKSYFYGIKKVGVPAINQTLEQIACMAVVFIIAPLFAGKGLQAMCTMIIIGVISGELISFCHIFWSFRRNKANGRTARRGTDAIKELTQAAIPITLNRTLISFIDNFQNVMTPIKFREYGMSASQALSFLGELRGMVMPLLYFPSMLTNALSMNLLPLVAEANAQKDRRRIQRAIDKALWVSLGIGIAAGIVFALFGRYMGMLFYKNRHAGEMLAMLAGLCPFMYISSTFSGVMNGLGLHYYAFFYSLAGDAIVIPVMLFLVPVYGTNVHLIALAASCVLVAMLNLRRVYSTINGAEWR